MGDEPGLAITPPATQDGLLQWHTDRTSCTAQFRQRRTRARSAMPEPRHNVSCWRRDSHPAKERPARGIACDD
jgi:hypothetical protein